MNLRLKFNITLSIVFLIGLIMSSYFFYTLLHKNTQSAVLEKAGVMMGAASAVRHYTVTQVKPHLEMQLSRSFLPQSVPAYAATETFNKLRELYPDYTYKEATLNPTNPRDRATDWENLIIQEFINDRSKKEITTILDTPNGKLMYLARPIEIKNKKCLVCHSTPDAAPKTMLARYGVANGFNWKMHEIIGAQIVAVPMSVPLQKTYEAFKLTIAFLIFIFLLLMISVNILLSYTVIKPIAKMSSLAKKIGEGDMTQPELKENGKDEISVLAHSFNLMKRSLEQAMKLIQ